MSIILPSPQRRRSSRLLHKKAADKQKQQSGAPVEVLVELEVELVDADEAADQQGQQQGATAEVLAEWGDERVDTDEDPCTCTFCGHVNPHDEPHCEMERITPHVAPTSWTGPALSHPPCRCCTTPCPPDVQCCPACQVMLRKNDKVQ